FNLQKSFNLSDGQYDELMKAGHIPDNLLSYEETTGASETINKWVDEGHEVFVITGRPFDAYK
ncbi:MAG TPA: 2-dehydropantoate 2-reductase, partial [Bacteroides sp.]|nr:2-dehydropantoate 2-reductase [Bacteroides sp.]